MKHLRSARLHWYDRAGIFIAAFGVLALLVEKFA